MSTERDAFEAALKALMVAEGCMREGEIITSYIVTGSAVGDDPERVSYFRDFQGGQQPYHVTLGLIELVKIHLTDEALGGEP